LPWRARLLRHRPGSLPQREADGQKRHATDAVRGLRQARRRRLVGYGANGSMSVSGPAVWRCWGRRRGDDALTLPVGSVFSVSHGSSFRARRPILRGAPEGWPHREWLACLPRGQPLHPPRAVRHRTGHPLPMGRATCNGSHLPVAPAAVGSSAEDAIGPPKGALG
jgi:hypothetical protein